MELPLADSTDRRLAERRVAERRRRVRRSQDRRRIERRAMERRLGFAAGGEDLLSEAEKDLISQLFNGKIN